ncbi:hypothetical protein B0H15DRAFT_516927 [Mycena belliarum]|uniref:Uncharacterized protein n=1 Tax=Mycena belliarum TaxID=1033014 RepID=A0AAD6XPU5_9AGAR|nr:hypothetical protein B0H15DRAFT_516927 [Mycena belliae]
MSTSPTEPASSPPHPPQCPLPHSHSALRLTGTLDALLDSSAPASARGARTAAVRSVAPRAALITPRDLPRSPRTTPRSVCVRTRSTLLAAFPHSHSFPASLAARYPAPSDAARADASANARPLCARGSEQCCHALRPPPTFPARPRRAAQSRPYYAPTVTKPLHAPPRVPLLPPALPLSPSPSPLSFAPGPAHPLPPHTSPPASNSSRSITLPLARFALPPRNAIRRKARGRSLRARARDPRIRRSSGGGTRSAAELRYPRSTQRLSLMSAEPPLRARSSPLRLKSCSNIVF